MKLTITRKHGDHNIGETVEATPATGEWLTRHGYAIEAKPEPKPEPKLEPKIEEKLKRTARKTRKNTEVD